MTLDEYRTRPDWQDYELTLIGQGWAPYWDPTVERLVVDTTIVCPTCGQRPAYVGMRKAEQLLAFVVCRCGHWGWFRPPGGDPRA